MSAIGRPQLRRAEFYGVGVAVLFVAAMALSSIAVGSGDVMDRLGLLSPELIAGLLALSLINYGLRTWRWHLFGLRLGITVAVRPHGPVLCRRLRHGADPRKARRSP